MLYIGIDVHKRNHEVVILDEGGKPRGRSFKISNTHEDLNSLFTRIEKLNIEAEPLRFVMEATGPYWMALCSHLRAANQEVVILNPLRTYAYRARSIRPAKNDRIDAASSQRLFASNHKAIILLLMRVCSGCVN